MDRSRLICRAAAALALIAVPVSAQGVILVPDHYSEIGLAVQAAAPGSTILVRFTGRAYQPFVIDRSVTIVGLGSQNRTPTILVGRGIGIDVRLAPGDQVHLSRIDVFATASAGPTTGVSIVGGRVALEDCEIGAGRSSGAFGQAALDVVGATVDLVHTRIMGIGAAIGTRIQGGHLTAVQSRSFGGTGPITGDGCAAIDSTVHGSAFEVYGGDGAAGGQGGHGLVATGATAVWLTDPLAAGGIGSPAGSGLVNRGTIPIELLRGSVFGGFDTATATRAPGTVGATTLNPNLLASSLGRPLYRAGALRLGLPFGMQLRGAVGLPVMVLIGGAPSQLQNHPLVRQPISLPSAPWLGVAGVLDSRGFFTVSGTVPNVSALLGVQLWFQGVGGAAIPLEAAPICGAAVRG